MIIGTVLPIDCLLRIPRRLRPLFPCFPDTYGGWTSSSGVVRRLQPGSALGPAQCGV